MIADGSNGCMSMTTTEWEICIFGKKINTRKLIFFNKINKMTFGPRLYPGLF
jgi:hypothetical protein